MAFFHSNFNEDDIITFVGGFLVIIRRFLVFQVFKVCQVFLGLVVAYYIKVNAVTRVNVDIF